MKPDSEKVKAVVEYPRPITKTHIRSFLGLAGYYRKFIPNFAEIASPLTDLTKKSAPVNVVWNDECEQAFQLLKQTLVSVPVLNSPDFSNDFVLQTDASNRGLGAVFSQKGKDGEEHPVMYLSRKLLPREENYPIIEKECLAIVWAVQKLHKYLYGRLFTIQTDHKPLTWLEQMKGSNRRLVGWSLLLQPYKIKVEHKPGTNNNNADALSRMY